MNSVDKTGTKIWMSSWCRILKGSWLDFPLLVWVVDDGYNQANQSPEQRRIHPLVKPDNYSLTRQSNLFLYFEDEMGVKVNIKQRKMEGSALTRTPCKGVGRSWPKNAAGTACTVGLLSVFVQSTLMKNIYSSMKWRNFYITCLKWNLDISIF